MLLDSTDVRIFCEMAFRDLGYEKFTERRPSAGEMGKKLGLDEKTVRSRVNRMEESGFIKYYQATPSLALSECALSAFSGLRR
jgi:DNA-binding Lrp family transcriptional regulator